NPGGFVRSHRVESFSKADNGGGDAASGARPWADSRVVVRREIEWSGQSQTDADRPADGRIRVERRGAGRSRVLRGARPTGRSPALARSGAGGCQTGFYRWLGSGQRR